MSIRKFNWRRDPSSSKDWSARRLLKTVQPLALPESVSLSYLIPSILDQGGLGSCAANALAQAIRAALLRVGSINPPIVSRLMLYYYARAIDNEQSVDAGTNFRNLLDVCRKLGVAPEMCWPYDDGSIVFKIPPSAAAQRLANDQIGGLTYYRIDSDGEDRLHDIRTAIVNKHLVVFGVQVTETFAVFGSSAPPIPLPKDGESFLGGHGLALAEYGPGYFGGPNSWGTGYGVNGWFRMTPEYLASDLAGDFWVIDTSVDFSEI
jgi:hypothetical protein